MFFFSCTLNSATLRLVHNGTFIAHFLYQPEESTFTVECLGSGTLHWQDPSGTNISYLSSSSVYQSSDLIQSKQTLHFKTFSGVSSGMHTCRSSLGISESIMISNREYFCMQKVLCACNLRAKKL